MDLCAGLLARCGGTGGGARAGNVGTIILLKDPRNCQL